MLVLNLLFVLLEQCQGAWNHRNCANAVHGFGCADDYAAFRCAGNASLNPNRAFEFVNVAPFQSHTFTPPYACCYQQLQYTVKVQCSIRQQLEKFCRLFCGQCVNGLFLFLGCADLSHWILRYHFLLFGVAKYQIERSV